MVKRILYLPEFFIVFLIHNLRAEFSFPHRISRGDQLSEGKCHLLIEETHHLYHKRYHKYNQNYKKIFQGIHLSMGNPLINRH